MLASCYHPIVLPDRAERGPEDRLSEPKASPMPPLARSQAFTDLVFATGVVCVSLPWASPSESPFRYMSGLTAVLMLAAFQFAVEGLVPLIAVRRERLSAYGFTMRNAGKSVAFAVMFAAAYDLASAFIPCGRMALGAAPPPHRVAHGTCYGLPLESCGPGSHNRGLGLAGGILRSVCCKESEPDAWPQR